MNEAETKANNCAWHRNAQGRAVELMEVVDDFGVMHIVVGDGNVEDGNLAFVEKQMETEGATAEERELIDLLKAMTVETRENVWTAYAYGDALEP